MKLYCFPPSHHSWRVLTTLAFLDIEDQVDVNILNLLKGEHRDSEILDRNPTGRLPILVDDELVLWESNAIMQYLADQYGPSPLYPKDPKARADVNGWLSWQMCHLASPTGTYLFQNMLKPLLDMGEPDQAKLAEAEENFKSCATALDRHLQDNENVCGKPLTLADISIATCFGYAEQAKMPWSGYDNIHAWFTRIGQIDAWKRTVPQFDIDSMAKAS